MVETPTLERVRINFSWIVKLRWAAAAGQLVTILFVQFGLAVTLPLYWLFFILAFECFSNLLLVAWFRGLFRRDAGPPSAVRIESALGSIMLVDILLLTLLLYLTGGPTNPFSVFYVVNIVLAAVVLKPAWTWALTLLALAAYGVLFVAHVPLPALEQMSYAPPDPGKRTLFLGRLSIFLKGLLTAVGMAVAVIVWFVTRLNHELTSREAELAEERQRKARAERLEALGTLAAGAAHELSSPLSTIAVIAKDLEVHLGRAGAAADVVEDAQLIRREVRRCREILDQMAFDAGQSAGEEIRSTPIGGLVDDALAGMKGAERVDRFLPPDGTASSVALPRRAVGLALRQVVKNALDASPADARVQLRVDRRPAGLVFTVEDHGTGMNEKTLERAVDPFFTTKEPGQGMGLGLFLTQTVVERLGGRLEFDSQPGHGTKVRMTLPAGSGS
jgi:two-component system sensor histidine kinase RegB